MNIKKSIIEHYTQSAVITSLLNKELLIGLYFLLFILGRTIGISDIDYNDFRVVQITLLLVLGIGSWFYQRYSVTKVELLFFSFMVIGSFFWQQPIFIIIELLLVYLLYKNFQILNYQSLIAKLIVLSSLSMFLLLPLSIWDYINTGVYRPNWYPLSLNIRVYDSYFLIVSIFALWFYLTEEKYRNFYLLFLFVAFLAVLLDGGRSVTLAYSALVITVSIFYRSIRWPLISVYGMAWFANVSIAYYASLNVISSQSSGLRILRTATYERLDLLLNAYQCWLQHPIIGCGFYQLNNHRDIAAHPHNLYLQVLSETGLIGFGFLVYIIVTIIKRMNWQHKHSYFVVAALLAIGIDLTFSGVYIYPITQMALLWLFVFLLKNPAFAHAQYFKQMVKTGTVIERYLSLIIYLIIAIIFIYFFIDTTALTDHRMSLPPRFWINGYELF